MPGPGFIDNLHDISPGPLVLFAGAGLSLWHPASLPTWREFNEVLLGEAKERGLRALDATSEAGRILDALTLDDVGMKPLSNALVEVLAGASYFNVLGSLDADIPNEAHRAVARLVRQGVIAAIVTTNFDSLIERALTEEGIAFDCYTRSFHYRRENERGCAIFKIHGSAGQHATLIDTVGQKLRGLPGLVRARLQRIFSRYPVLVLGYSGGDLEFAADYLALRCIPPGADRIWWVVRPEERDKIEATTRDLVSVRGKFVLMHQADALGALGAGPITLERRAETRAAVLDILRAQARTMYAQLGNLNTLAFCMRLLSAAGRMRSAADVWQHLADAINRRKKTIAALGPAMRALAAEGHRLFGVEAQREWACRHLTDIQRRRVGVATGLHSDAYVRDARDEGLACLLLGDAMVRQGRNDEAGIAMESAMTACEYLGDIALLPAVYRLYGWREVLALTRFRRSKARLRELDDSQVQDLISHESTARGYLLAAEAAGLVAGNMEAMDSAWIRADMLVDLGEYDAALTCVERLEERIGLGVHLEIKVRIEALKGEVDVRQGRKAQAMARLTTCLAQLAHHNPYLEAYVKHLIIGRIGFAPEWRNQVLKYCDEILRSMADGVLPADGRSDLITSRRYYQTVKVNLAALGSKPIPPGFIQDLDPERTQEEFYRWPAYYIRQHLIHEEFRGRTTRVLSLLDELVAAMFLSGHGEGAFEAASAHLRRALQEKDEHQEFAARANVASIQHWLGEATESAAWYAGALQKRRAREPKVRSGLKRRLPHALWSIKAPRVDDFPHYFGLELLDALAMKRAKAQTGKELERTAARFVDDTNFVMGRVLALEAIAAFRNEGDPGGVQRSFALLDNMAQREIRSGKRSGRSPMGLCRDPIRVTMKGKPDLLI
jgi:tetratricopeptide (TPR) repeat protein